MPFSENARWFAAGGATAVLFFAAVFLLALTQSHRLERLWSKQRHECLSKGGEPVLNAHGKPVSCAGKER